jgi:hypothetical protein
VPVVHRPPAEPALHVHGFEFTHAGYWPNHRTPAEDAPAWVCKELKSELIRYGHDSWGIRMHRAEGTGYTAAEAFAAAYRKLDAKADEMTLILNAVHERSGITV